MLLTAEQIKPISIVLDRLSVCINDPNPDAAMDTAKLLLDWSIGSQIPGAKLVSNARYKVSARIPVPFQTSALERHVICFEAGPHQAGTPSYRLDFNPAKLTEAGLEEVMMLIDSVTNFSPFEFFNSGKITRVDVAVDLAGMKLNDVILLSQRRQKHGVYCDRLGFPETVYLGTPRSNRVVGYDKREKGIHKGLRIECRLKPLCFGSHIAHMSNPFDKMLLLPAQALDGVVSKAPGVLIADHIRLRGLKRALKTFSQKQQLAIKKRLTTTASLLPDTAEIWQCWPLALENAGLGKELGLQGANFKMAAE